MTEDRKNELARKLIARDLTEEDRSDLAEAVKKDEEFREELRFDIGFAEAMERERYDKVEERRKRKALKKKWRLRIAIVVGILILAGLSYLAYTKMAPSPEPFTPEEGMELMEEVIANSKTDKRISVVAGTDSWSSLMATEPLTNSNLEKARNLLLEVTARNGNCDDTEVAYFLGTIELYVYRNYDAAENYLECIARDEDFSFPEDAALPVTLMHLGKGDLPAAAERFNLSGLSYDRLPARARRLISDYNE